MQEIMDLMYVSLDFIIFLDQRVHGTMAGKKLQLHYVEKLPWQKIMDA